MITIYHNPRCSKSRETLALLEQYAAAQQEELHIVDYQKTPLNLVQLQTLLAELGGDVQQMLRPNEDAYKAENLAQADTTTALSALLKAPLLLQRPIVSYRGKAMIGRPPEQVLGLFPKVSDHE
jgi:arsenate reductase